LLDGVELKIKFIDKRNSKVVAQSSVRWDLYVKKKLADNDTTPLLDIADLFPIYQI